jgi:hypothetical protein
MLLLVLGASAARRGEGLATALAVADAAASLRADTVRETALVTAAQNHELDHEQRAADLYEAMRLRHPGPGVDDFTTREAHAAGLRGAARAQIMASRWFDLAAAMLAAAILVMALAVVLESRALALIAWVAVLAGVASAVLAVV